MNGSPPFPGTRVKCVDAIQPPFARIASATGFRRAGSAAIAAFGFYAALRSGSASAHAREIDRLETARPPAGMYTRAEFEDARASAHRWSRISTAALGTGVITLGIGAALMYFGGREPADGLPPFAVTPPATGAGAVVTREVAW